MKRRRTNARSSAVQDATVAQQRQVEAPSPLPPSPATGPERRPKRGARGALATTATRLQPSEPLHMTTRSRAVSTSATNSVVSGNSRRSSLNSIHNQTTSPSDNGDESRPRKRTKVFSNTSTSPKSAHVEKLEYLDAHMSDESDLEAPDMTRTNTEDSRTSSKRKRESEPLDVAPTTETNGQLNGTSFENEEAADKVEELQKVMPRPKRRSTRAHRSLDAPPISSADSSTPNTPPYEVPDIGPTQLDLETIIANTQTPEVATEVAANSKKKLPGRRRAAHADPVIEASLRQQLAYRMGYRQLAKVLKNFDYELVCRQIKELEEDPEAHTIPEAYLQVCGELDQILEAKLEALDKQRAIKMETIKRQREAEEHILRNQAIMKMKEIQEEYDVRQQYRLMEIERNLFREDDEATEPEYDLLPPLDRVRFNKTKDATIPSVYAPLPSKYNSRSRVFIETEKLARQAIRRHDLRQQQQQFKQANASEYDELSVSDRTNFAVLNDVDRDHAISVHNAKTLVEAAEAIESGRAIVPAVHHFSHVPNEKATGLQFLADLAAVQPQPPLRRPNLGIAGYTERPVTPASRMPVLPLGKTPEAPSSATSAAMSLETPNEHTPAVIRDTRSTPEPSGRTLKYQAEDSQTGVRPDTTPRAKIMDILNRDEPQNSPSQQTAHLNGSHATGLSARESSNAGSIGLLPPIRTIESTEAPPEQARKPVSGFWSTIGENPSSPNMSRQRSPEKRVTRSSYPLTGGSSFRANSMGPPERRTSFHHEHNQAIMSPASRASRPSLPPMDPHRRSHSQEVNPIDEERRRSISAAKEGKSPSMVHYGPPPPPPPGPPLSRSQSHEQAPPHYHEETHRPSYAQSTAPPHPHAAQPPGGHYSPASYHPNPHHPYPYPPPPPPPPNANHGHPAGQPYHPHYPAPQQHYTGPYAASSYPPPAGSPPNGSYAPPDSGLHSPAPPAGPYPPPSGAPGQHPPPYQAYYPPMPQYGPPGPSGPPQPPHGQQQQPPQPLHRTRGSRGKRGSGSANANQSSPQNQMQSQFSANPQVPGKQPLLPAPSDGRSPVSFQHQQGRQQYQPPPPRTQGPTSGEQVLPKKRHRQYSTVPGTIFRGYQPPKRN